MRSLGVITAHFNSEHYLQLRAWQRGWVPQRVAETPDRCPGGVEVWKKGEHALFQIRLDDPYGIGGVDGDDYAAMRLRDALPCPALAVAPLFISDFFPPLSVEPLARALREPLAVEPPVLVSFAWPVTAAARIDAFWGWRNVRVPLTYGINRSAPIGPAQLRRVAALAEARLADRTGHPGEPLPPHIDDLLPRFRTRYWPLPASPVDEAARRAPAAP